MWQSIRTMASQITWLDVESIGLIWQWFDDNPTTWGEFESKFCIHGKE